MRMQACFPMITGIAQTIILHLAIWTLRHLPCCVSLPSKPMHVLSTDRESTTH